MARKTQRARYIEQASALARLLHEDGNEAAYRAKLWDRNPDQDVNADDIRDVIEDVRQGIAYIERTLGVIESIP